MPSLRTLSICTEHVPAKITDPILEVLLASLVLSSLSSFELSCGLPSSSGTGYYSWPSSLLTILQHSSATLRYMSLHLDSRNSSKASWGRLSVLLKTIPHISHLHLKDSVTEKAGSNQQSSSWDDLIVTFLSDLADVGSGNPILPDLTHLTLTNINVTPGIKNAVVATAALRIPSRLSVVGNDVRALEELWVMPCYAEPPSPDVLEVIAELKRDGVNVLFKSA
ncbi:hypothetical protein E1B28_003605 [Marasmius oreades]|uniref:Uncharacterized protein n=1 Tax=Marasmius oreades TaxID=181124 RepID=A0A9P7UL29_9AGAR|nr:uncharacterized protein E1B28_003605 [Marasmius oreades]KAG7086090.1 hypothetical protein E1B28_003605 [Marasmius oreades]